MKKVAKSFVVAILGWQVRRLRHKHSFKVIGVAGSMGKTSTKFAIATVLQQKYRVRFQEGNYNDVVSVPLIFFNKSLPSLFSPPSWLKVFISNELVLRKPYPFDIVIVELGTDGPGQIAQFSKYLHLDIGVVTAISPEHMEHFSDLNAVANEEFKIAGFSNQLFVNTELCSQVYFKKINNDWIGYGNKDAQPFLDQKNKMFSKAQLFSSAAALTVGNHLSLNKQQLTDGLKSTPQISGRMNLLKGINGSTIIDDTYNASPEAVKEALETLYRFKSPQKIAVLGSMNELGKFSTEAHEDIGSYCDPKQLDAVVSIGKEANQYLAPAAERRGCKVEQFESPYEAGEYLKQIIEPNSVILAKGSQNGVFAEEAIKCILANPKDRALLVRQSPKWLKIKNKQFNRKATA